MEQPQPEPEIEKIDEELTPEEAALDEGNRNRKVTVRILRKRLRQDRDATIAITGARGIGKTRLASCLAKEIDSDYTITKNMLFDPRVDILHKLIYEQPKYSAFVVDELIRIGYRRNWQKKQNKLLNELYNLSRYRNQASLLCIPNFNDIDKDLQDVIVFWIVVVDRGVAIIFRADDNPYASDKWHVRESEVALRDEFKGKPLHFFTTAEFIRALAKSPNYMGWFTYPDFTPEEKREYDALKIPYDLNASEDQDDTKIRKETRDKIESAEKAVANLIQELLAKKYTTQDLEATTGLSKERIGRILKHNSGLTLKETKKKINEEKQAAGFAGG